MGTDRRVPRVLVFGGVLFSFLCAYFLSGCRKAQQFSLFNRFTPPEHCFSDANFHRFVVINWGFLALWA